MMKNIVLTIFTPTYNRAYCLPRLYDSLLRQTHHGFKWIVIDDGSTDNTRALVEEWQKEARIYIEYFYQNNQGKMSAMNRAHELCDTTLVCCLDSDDFFLDDAVSKILDAYNFIKDNSKVAGIAGLDVYSDGSIVGRPFPDNEVFLKFSDFNRVGAVGDKKYIYKTDVIKKFPKYPSIDNEKFPAPGYLYRLIDQDYDLYVINEPLCVVEYLQDGISQNKFSQYMNSPKSFMFYRQERIRMASNASEKFMNAVHYVSSCRFANISIYNSQNNYKFLTTIAYPFGLLLHIYLNNTKKKGVI